MDTDCTILDNESFILQTGNFITWITLLTVLHAILAYAQGRLWKGENIWGAKTIFFYSLIYFPIGFLGLRAWTLFKLRHSKSETILFTLLFFLFVIAFWKCGIKGEWGSKNLILNFDLGVGSSAEGISCQTSTWPFSTPFAFLSYLANLLILHHLAWPIFELSFLGLKKISK